MLARKHITLRKLAGIAAKEWPKTVRSASRVLARAAALRDAGSETDGHKLVMNAMLKLCFGKASFGLNYENLNGIGIRQWRRETWKILMSLPPASTTVDAWGPAARAVLERFFAESKWPCAMKLSASFCRCNGKDAATPVLDFCSVAPSHSVEHLVVHQAKGRTFDGVLLLAAGGSKGTPADIEQWLKTPENDETRVAYVAVSRPRKLLVVAVPESTPKEPLERLAQRFVIERI